MDISSIDYIKKAEDRIRENSDQYGEKLKNFEDIACIFYILTGIKLSPVQCCMMLISLKLSRQKHKHKSDNIVDIIGYVAILGELYDGYDE